MLRVLRAVLRSQLPAGSGSGPGSLCSGGPSVDASLPDVSSSPGAAALSSACSIPGNEEHQEEDPCFTLFMYFILKYVFLF